jgi:hypothetical protein
LPLLRTIACILLPVLETRAVRGALPSVFPAQGRALFAHFHAKTIPKTIHRAAFVRVDAFPARISPFSYFSQNIFPIIHDSITRSGLEWLGRICYNIHTMATYTIRLPVLPTAHFFYLF